MKKKNITITVDGPAGSGKSSVGKRLAEKLKFTYIDTGAMYRAIALRAFELGISADDDEGLNELCGGVELKFDGDNLFMDGRDVTSDIRTPEMDALSSAFSSRAPVRKEMIALQRRMAADGGVVMEGRDIGTVVLPDADAKFFITASPEVRGQRRYKERIERGEDVDLDKIVSDMVKRDDNDSRRELSPLKPAEDATIIDTTDINIDEVITIILKKLEDCVLA